MIEMADNDEVLGLSLIIRRGNLRTVFNMRGVGERVMITKEDDLPEVVNLLSDALNEARKLVVKSGRKGYHDVDMFYPPNEE